MHTLNSVVTVFEKKNIVFLSSQNCVFSLMELFMNSTEDLFQLKHQQVCLLIVFHQHLANLCTC